MAGLGEILRRAREDRGVTLEEAERVTHIARRYLTALEDEDFTVFPAPVFGRGFLRNYSQYLGLNTEDVLSLWPGGNGSQQAPDERNGADAPSRRLRFGLPGRGSAAQELPEEPEQEPDTDRPRPRLPLRSVAPERPEIPARPRPWESLRSARRAARAEDMPGPLTRGVAPEPLAADTSALRPLMQVLIPLVAILIVAFLVAKAAGHSGFAPKASGTGAALQAGGATQPSGGPAPRAGSMPRLVGVNSIAALQQLRTAGVTPIVVTAGGAAATGTPGSVLQQEPSPGASLTTSSTVTLVVAAGGALPSAAPSVVASPRATGTPAPVRGIAPSATVPSRVPSATPRVP